jgi:hypothetical protein
MAEIIGTGIQRSGKTSELSVQGVLLTQSKWSCIYSGVDLPTLNFQSAGLDEGILGPEGLRWEFSGDWDAGTNSYDDPPGVYPRDNLPNLLMILNPVDAQVFDMPYARVRSSTVATDVNGLVTFQASGMSQGPFTVPTGSV